MGRRAFPAPARAARRTPPRSKLAPSSWRPSGANDWAAIRANSATDVLLHSLPGAPILTVHSAEALIDRTFKPTHTAIGRLVEAGILRPITITRRNRAYEAPEIIEAFTALERQLASPAGDTRASRPVRPVPYRPK